MNEVVRMKNKTKKSITKEKTMYQEVANVQDELFDRCIRKGLIEKTPYGYYFTPEFFETLDIYKEE
jgi:effector-binding domain-containing protein